MRPARLTSLVVGAGLVLAAAGCSAGSSTGGGPPTGGSPLPTSATTIDRATVDAALTDVLSGLRTLHSVPATAGVGSEVSGLRSAATDLQHGADRLTPSPAGVPDAAAVPVSAGLSRVAALMTQTASCLAGAGGNQAATTSCAAPLQQADSATGKLARELITLAAYGSRTPTAFEQDLATALHG